MKFSFDRLKQLTETSGIPGYEDRIRALVHEDLEATTDFVRADGMGNVVGTTEGESDYEVATVAHMDEVGFTVRHIDDEGFLQLDVLGGRDPRVLRIQRVIVHVEGKNLTGVIDLVPPHTLMEGQKQKELKVEDVYVDLGLSVKTAERTVSVGDFVTMEQTAARTGNHVTGKTIGSRVCPLTMPKAAKRIENPRVTTHFAATAQEEVGPRGMQVLGVDLDPDFALDLGTTVANDVSGSDPADHVMKPGMDAGIRFEDPSAIVNPKVHRRFRVVAKDNDIPYQMELLPTSGADTGGFQSSYGAKPVGAIPIPTRYLHIITENVHEGDAVTYISLLTAFLENEMGEFNYTL